MVIVAGCVGWKFCPILNSLLLSSTFPATVEWFSCLDVNKNCQHQRLTHPWPFIQIWRRIGININFFLRVGFAIVLSLSAPRDSYTHTRYIVYSPFINRGERAWRLMYSVVSIKRMVQLNSGTVPVHTSPNYYCENIVWLELR